jgi:hypothetical protein
MDKLNQLLESAERELQAREERLSQLDNNLAGKLMMAMMMKTIQKFQGSMEETLESSGVRRPKSMGPVSINGITYVPLADAKGNYVVQANFNDVSMMSQFNEEDVAIPNDSIDNLQTKVCIGYLLLWVLCFLNPKIFMLYLRISQNHRDQDTKATLTYNL